MRKLHLLVLLSMDLGFFFVCVCAVGSMFTAFKGLKNCVAIAANIFLEFSPQLNLNSVPYD